MKRCTLIPVLFLIAGCGGGDEAATPSTSPPPTTPSAIGMKSAINVSMAATIGMFVSSTSGLASIRTDLRVDDKADLQILATGQYLYALMNDGSISTVSLADVALPRIRQIADTPLATVVQFDFDEDSIAETTLPNGSDRCGAVLVRKSDGALFCVTHGIYSLATTPDGTKVFTYGKGLDGVMGYWRLSVSADSAPTAVKVHTGNEFAAFAVNSDGDLLLSAGGVSTRIYKGTGGIQNFGESAMVVYAGNAVGDSSFYFIDWASNDLKKLTKAADTFSSSVVYDYPAIPDGSEPYAAMSQIGSCGLQTPLVAVTGKLFGLQSFAATDLIEFSNGTPAKHALPALTSATCAKTGGDLVYASGINSASGNSVIIRFDPSDNSQATIVAHTDNYSVTSISVAADGELTFGALRNADGHRVIGKVPAGTTAISWVSEDAGNVEVLTRIN